jgi:Flp pilus assembly protein TadG
MVETAMTIPLLVFLLLGVMQMSLLAQARAMTKYAAYRAARAGALNNACCSSDQTCSPNIMQNEAIAALLPVIAANKVNTNDALLVTGDATTFKDAYNIVTNTIQDKYQTSPALPIVQVRICGPLQSFLTGSTTFSPQDDSTHEVDFDYAWNNEMQGSSSQQMIESVERNRLRVQVKFYVKLIIPFANAVIFNIWSLQQGFASLMTGGMYVADDWEGEEYSTDLDVGQGGGGNTQVGTPMAEDATDAITLSNLAMDNVGLYYMPIYGNYAFRMQSNYFLTKCPLPTQNNCFHYSDPNDSTAGSP